MKITASQKISIQKAATWLNLFLFREEVQNELAITGGVETQKELEDVIKDLETIGRTLK